LPLAEESDAGGNSAHKSIFPVGPAADDEPPLEALDPPGLLAAAADALAAFVVVEAAG
jgi:hypothetical protein